VPALRIVFDTNVYISAALHGRQAETVLELASAGLLTLVTSPAILAELEEKLVNKLGWSLNRVELFLETIRDLAEVIDPQITVHVVPDDEDDNRIIECAIAGEAGLIVTFDKDLLRLRSYETVGIITPRQLSFYGLTDENSQPD
jgi:putative PIN family toxin of toxin-antitoxin system